jgi:hypothetical protein
MFAAGHDCYGKHLMLMGLENQSSKPVNVNMTLECEHDIRIRVCTVRGNSFVAVFLFVLFFAVRTACFECRSGPRLSNVH